MSVPPGKGGKPYGKSPKNSSFLNMVRLNRTPFSHLKIYGLTVHIVQNFSIFQKRPIKSKFQRITQISAQFAHTVRELHEIRTIY